MLLHKHTLQCLYTSHCTLVIQFNGQEEREGSEKEKDWPRTRTRGLVFWMQGWWTTGYLWTRVSLFFFFFFSLFFLVWIKKVIFLIYSLYFAMVLFISGIVAKFITHTVLGKMILSLLVQNLGFVVSHWINLLINIWLYTC